MKKKNLFVISLLVVAAILFSVAFAHAETTVKYDKKGIALSHPAGWTFKELGEPGAYHGVNGFSADKLYAISIVVFDDKSVDTSQLGTYNKSFLDGQKVKVTASKNVEEQLLGSKMRMIQSNFVINNLPYESKVFAASLNGKAVYIVKEYPIKKKADAEKVLNGIINTIKVK